jgi:hypothetical protein
MFLDRIYTVQDSDIELFKQYAEKNDWWTKKRQSMEPDEVLTNGTRDIRNPEIICKVDTSNPTGCYPYMDTMCFINVNENIIGNSLDAVDAEREHSNDYSDYEGPIRLARSTEGEWYTPD